MKRKLNEHDVPEAVAGGVSANTPHNTFSSLGLDPRLLQAVNHEQFGVPTLVQLRAIPIANNGENLLVRAKTGSGKTLAYLLPILNAILRRKSSSKRKKATTALILVPTKELAAQVSTTVRSFTSFCAQEVKCENITRKEDVTVTRARLAEEPDIVVATPGRACQCMNNNSLNTDQLKHLVIDEADLVSSYGYEDDLKSIASTLPSGVQKIMVSATLRADADALSSLFLSTEAAIPAAIVDLAEEESTDKSTLHQYTIRSAEDEKFLLIYAIFKLRLIKGKIIMFVADIDRCYRVKMFLEQFGVRSCVLNSELPVNSRLHVVEEFNRGAYDIIIAADEGEVIGNEKRNKRSPAAAEQPQNEGTDDAAAAEAASGLQESKVSSSEPTSDTAKSPARKKIRASGKKHHEDREYGVSRGIDFRHVTCVLNFDMPSTSKSYTHRIGRTARAGQAGMALSFYVPSELYRKHKPTSIPQCQNDEATLAKIKAKQAAKGAEIKEWDLDWTKLDGFRYRLADALRAVTRIAVREARARELREELIKSEKLKRHFEENPDDLRHLRHDTATHAVRQQAHLKHVPSYLLPSGGTAAVASDVGFVGMRRDGENRIRKSRALNKARGKGRIARTRGLDPLRSLNVRGRAKK